jgi:hypothetical protein
VTKGKTIIKALKNSNRRIALSIPKEPIEESEIIDINVNEPDVPDIY